MESKKILKTLKRRMKTEGLTQSDIARDLDTNKYTIHRWLTGKSFPSDAYVRLLKMYLEV